MNSKTLLLASLLACAPEQPSLAQARGGPFHLDRFVPVLGAGVSEAGAYRMAGSFPSVGLEPSRAGPFTILGGFAIPSVPHDVTITFDDRPEGETIGEQFPGIIFAGSPTIRHLAGVGPPPRGFLRSTPSPATGDHAGPLRFDFAEPQSRVRAYLLGGQPGQEAELRVFSREGDTFRLEGRARALLPTTPGQVVQLEIFRVLSQDIARVEVEYSTNGVEAIDTLEYETFRPAWSSGVVDFDTFAAGTRIQTAIAGVRFLDDVWVESSDRLGTRVGSEPNAVIKRLDVEADRGPLRLQFDPPQGAVRFRLGYPAVDSDGRPLTVTVRALTSSVGGLELARLERRFEAVHDIDVPVELSRWRERDIRVVEILFDRSLGGQEVIDDLEFAPARPLVAPDRTPPVATLTSPAEGTHYFVDRPSITDFGVRFTGRIIELHDVASARLEIHNLDSDRHESQEVEVRPESINTFVVESTPRLGLGQNRVRLVAVDEAGNVSPEDSSTRSIWISRVPAAIVAGADPLAGPSRLQHVTGIRRAGPAISVTQPREYELRGLSFHPLLAVSLRPVGETALRITGEVPVAIRVLTPTRMEVELPELIFAQHDSRWAWVLRDAWDRPERVTPIEVEDTVASVQVTTSFPQLYGLGFQNVGGNSFGGEAYDGTFGLSLMLPGGFPRDPLAMLFLPVYAIWMSASQGHCEGMASVGAAIQAGWIGFDRFDSQVLKTGGYLAANRPASYRGPDNPVTWLFEVAQPRNLWAQVESLHGVQSSAEVLDAFGGQLIGVGLRANVVAALERIRPRPADHLISFFADGGGHVVRPYEVFDLPGTSISVVRVWDNNVPYNQAMPWDDPANVLARSARFRIDRARNTFAYCRNGGPSCPEAEVTGQGFFTIPVELLHRARHVPHLPDFLRFGRQFLVGAADGQMVDSAGHTVGWDERRNFTDDFPGVVLIPPTDGPEPAPYRNGVFQFSRPAHDAHLHARVLGNHYAQHLALDGAAVQLEVFDATIGNVDDFHVTTTDFKHGGVVFSPAATVRRVAPRVGFRSTINDGTVFHWSGLELPAGGSAGFGVDVPRRSASFANRTGLSRRFDLLVEVADTSHGAFLLAFGPFDLPAGASQAVSLPGWPTSNQLQVETDLDGDGVIDTTGQLEPRSVRPLDHETSGDLNGNGVPDLQDLAAGALVDTDGDGLPDAPAAVARPVLRWLGRTADAELRFEVGGAPGLTVAIERSTDLTQWHEIQAGTIGPAGTYAVTVGAATLPGAFFRAVHR